MGIFEHGSVWSSESSKERNDLKHSLKGKAKIARWSGKGGERERVRDTLYFDRSCV